MFGVKNSTKQSGLDLGRNHIWNNYSKVKDDENVGCHNGLYVI